MSTTSQTTRSVPFLDLGRIHEPLKETILERIADLIERNAYANGPEVAEFEAAYARYCVSEHSVGVASGLDALRLALQALEIGVGDEVVVPANTFIATFEAVSQVGATPVPVDVTNGDYNVDVDAVAAAIGSRTTCLMPVDLYGQLADHRALRELADRYGLAIVEDACQAHGATRDGARAGEFADAAAFSFYPGKNLGAMGDAGALVTNRSTIAERLRMLREHGQASKYHHNLVGWTSRLDTMQAIALLEKLPQLDGWNRDRARVADAYATGLNDVGDLVLPPVAPNSTHVWHLYVVRTADPPALAAHLQERGVGTGRHYPQPVHLSPAYAHLGYGEGAFPVSERLARDGLSLPMFPLMEDAEIEAVIEGVRSYFG